MGFIRSWLFRMIYPLPQSGEDLLVHKQVFIDEYTVPALFFEKIKIKLIAPRIKLEERRKDYIIKAKNKEQKERLLAYKTWHGITKNRD